MWRFLNGAKEKGMQCEYCIAQGCTHSFVSGCSSLKVDSIKKHEASDSHKRAASIEVAKSKPKFESIAFTYAQNMPCIVVINSRPLTDFSWMCDLDCVKGLDIGETYNRNHKSAQVFVNAIGDTEFNKVATEISKCGFVCLIGDGSTDYGIQEQEMWYCRTSRHGKIRTFFIGVHKSEKADAQGLVNGIKEIVSENLHLQWNEFLLKLIGLACDGASVMLGCRAGVRALLKGSAFIDNHLLYGISAGTFN
ncbi:ZN862-like protein [Mya arenaria]|uniref:ZN862-like protein n=1 Tax=Mya arenaria TaxID=6604 RepID=A0ABY7FGI3_MYAAR|nr:ZN862-like protein [Mya arenaria]